MNLPSLKSSPARLDVLESIQEDTSRFQDLSLKLRRKKTQEILLRAGGRWDRLERKYIGPAPRCKVIDLEESQVEFAQWMAAWLDAKARGDDARERLVLAGGPRRSGKTFVATFAVVAAALAQPGTINWLISPTFQKRDELERLIKGWLPRGWWKYRDAPIYRFTLTNGSTIQLLSGDDPEALKRGGASVALLNEAQEFEVGALSYSLPAIIDDGGLMILAANPPRRLKGEWILALRDGIIDQSIPGGRYLALAAGLNEQIDQAARSDVGAILSVIDPKAAVADDEGQWLPVGDRAYSRFDKKRNLVQLPNLVDIKTGKVVGDITAEWMRKRMGRAFSTVGGVDFQASPWHCGVVARIFQGKTPTEPVYHIFDELLLDGFEEEFLAEFTEKDYDHTDFLWVGDASGQFQDGEHTRGRQSFTIFKKHGWRIEPPVKKQSNKGEFSKNPHVSDRVALVNKLLEQGRLLIDPISCPRLAESIRECEMKMMYNTRKPGGIHSHITDALGYLLFFLEPRTKTYRKPNASGTGSISIPVTGPKLF